MKESGPASSSLDARVSEGDSLLRSLQARSLRSWILIGLCGALVVVAISPLWDAWVVNRAGVMVNRVLAATAADSQPTSKEALAAKPSTARTDAQASTPATADSEAGAKATPAAAKDEELHRDLEQAMALMEAAAAEAPHTAARETPIWRTYGAAASLVPSKHAYELLLRSRNAGRLDRIGELWLGEVASATGNDEEAAKAYRRMDASNVLLYRAETAMEEGDKVLATREYLLALESLRAVMERAAAEQLLLDRTGKKLSARSRLLQQPAERVTSLYRIGRGLVNAGQPSSAIPVLEEALRAAEADSPGTMVEQGLHLSLAMALARDLPQTSLSYRSAPTYFALNAWEADRIGRLTRIQGLIYHGVEADRTAPACVQAARILLQIEQAGSAVTYLRRALELDPLLPESYLLLGAHYEETGALSTARELYKKGTESIPADTRLSTAYALASFKTMPADFSLPLLEQETGREDVQDPFLFAALGDVYAELGLPGHALVAYEEGAKRFPNDPALSRRLALSPLSRNLMR